MTNKLHKIFSITGCLSDEVLHKYLLNELSKEEKHLVERHLVDCEICSDVLEGMSLVGDYKSITPIINKINSDVKSHIEKPKPKSRVIRLNSWIPYVAAAAIILFVISIFYMRQDYNENQVILAKKTIEPDETIMDAEKILLAPKENTVESNRENNALASKGFTDNDEDVKAIQKDFAFDSRGETSNEKIIADKDITEEFEISLDEAAENGVTAGATGKGNATATYTTDASYQPQPVVSSNVKTEDVQKEAAVSVNNIQDVRVVSTVEKKSPLNKNKDSKERKDSRQKSNKTKAKSAIAPNYVDIELQTEKAEISNEETVAQKEIITLTDSVQNNYIFNYSQNNTYNLAYSNYSSNNYKVAVGLFNVVLADSINHYNSLYYGGISYFQMNKNDSALIYFDKVLEVEKGFFYEDAMWYKALILKQTNKNSEAKLLLQSIINKKGKYKSQASELLKQLK